MSLDAPSTEGDAPLVDPYYPCPPEAVRLNGAAPAPSRPDAAGPPHAGHEPPPGGKLAIASAVLWIFGPLGAVASIICGALARRDGGRRGTANAGIALGIVGFLGWCAIGAFAVTRVLHWMPELREVPAVARTDDPQAAPDVDDPAAPPAMQPPASSTPGTSPRKPASVVAPDATKVTHVGGITVVDIGAKTAELRDALAVQRADAAKKGETLLLMTTAGGCEPCRGFDASLADAALQAALVRSRIVRVDVDVFREDLESLRVPAREIPGFFLLSPDLSPRDGINGGEWDDDIPANIGPVIGPFLQGTYGKRRKAWKPHTSSGVRL